MTENGGDNEGDSHTKHENAIYRRERRACSSPFDSAQGDVIESAQGDIMESAQVVTLWKVLRVT